MGLAFLLETAYLLPLTAITLLVVVATLGFRATGRRGYGPFAVGLVAAILVVVGKFVLAASSLSYGGITLLIASSMWNSWPKKRARCDLVELGVNSETLKRKGDE